MVNHDLATVREFMFCTWSQIRIERLFLQLIKKKLTSVCKFSPTELPQNTESPPFVPPTKLSEKFPLVLFKILVQRREGNYVFVFGNTEEDLSK